jgi:diaminopimelate epimerase
MTTMRATKHHGLGNDFVVVLASAQPGLRPDPERARQLCNRHFGIGADGLIWGMPGHDGADLTMVLHNSDGSEAEISGNGIRCLAQAHFMSLGRDHGEVLIDTPGGRRRLQATSVGPSEMSVNVDMGPVESGPVLNDTPNVVGAMQWDTARVGNPHLIVQVGDLAAVDPARDGAALEHAAPNGLNVHFLSLVGPDQLRLVHWERGAGVTLGCGSGATAAAALARSWGLVGDVVTVDMPGGSVQVTTGPDGSHLLGPAVCVAELVLR